MKCRRSEVTEVSLDARVPVAQRGICFFIFYYSPNLPCILLFNSHLASRSTPTKPKKAGVSESLAPPPRPMVDIIACLLFPPNLKTRLHVPDHLKFSISQEVTTGIASPPASCYKSVMYLHDCSPSVSTASNPPLQLIRRRCLLLPTRSFPGLPRTPARANCLAHGASCTDSR